MSHANANRGFEPGDVVRWYAAKCGWQLLKRNMFVEGETDAAYFRIAAELYAQKCGLRLLGVDLAVISVGVGNDGGTFGLVEKYPALFQLIQQDTCDGKRLFRAIALVDNDDEGRKACNYLTSRYTNLQENKDVFVLQRIYPRESQDPKKLISIIKSANEKWHSLNCEIEDLLSWHLLDQFAQRNARFVRRAPVRLDGAHHFELTPDGKAELCRCVRSAGVLEEFYQVIEVLKSLRYYLGVTVDGV